MNKVRILVVDDEPGFTRLIKLALPEYEIHEENNPTRALETARHFHPHLILLDVVMPELDGGDLAARLRAEPILARVPIVFLTAIVSPKECPTEQVIGGYPFVAKPVSREALVQCIEKVLGT
jgi:CheY-like chemotaxis protein